MLSRCLPIAALLAFASLAGAATAQEDLSSNELEARFKAQIVDGQQIRGLEPTEKYRGLVMIPSAAKPDATENVQEIEFIPVPEEHRIDLMIAFDLDSASLRPDQSAKLTEMCKAMTAMSDTRFRIIGHTDTSGPERYNDLLSVRRADAVLRNLTEECGIAPVRLEAVGVGERYLAVPEEPRSESNRRVEFQALG